MLLIVLTVLLPLRSTLALTMGLPDSGMVSGAGAYAAVMANTEETPCPHHATGASPHGSDSDTPLHSQPDSPHGSSHAHLLCDICNVPALDLQTRASPGTQLLPIGVPHRNERFASVVLPIGHKPPIPA